MDGSRRTWKLGLEKNFYSLKAQHGKSYFQKVCNLFCLKPAKGPDLILKHIIQHNKNSFVYGLIDGIHNL
jgi:hypothetical protein